MSTGHTKANSIHAEQVADKERFLSAIDVELKWRRTMHVESIRAPILTAKKSGNIQPVIKIRLIAHILFIFNKQK